MHADGRMDAGLSYLTTLDDDAEFERFLFVLRTTRDCADIHRTRSLQLQTRYLGQRLEVILQGFLLRFLLCADFFFRICKQ